MSGIELTVRDACEILGTPWRDQTTSPSPLDLWAAGIVDIPICQLSDFDLARTCRQPLVLEYTVPEAVKRLANEPLAGELYEGELAASIAEIPVEFWRGHSAIGDCIADLAAKALETIHADEYLAISAYQKLQRLHCN